MLEYDGTEFSGFQRQSNGRTVQGVVEAQLSDLYRQPVMIAGAGRTDAGVHATGQVIHYDVSGGIPLERLAEAVNRHATPEWRVRCAERTGSEFHARFDAQRRTYDYYICGERVTPSWARYVAFAPRLPVEAPERMREVLPLFLGRHDFRGFAAGGVTGSTVRCLSEARLDEKQGLLRLRLTADGFLWSMVRNITGALLEVGYGRAGGEELQRALVERVRPRGVKTAPAHGLFLSRVEYGDGFPPEPTPEPFGPFEASGC